MNYILFDLVIPIVGISFHDKLQIFYPSISLFHPQEKKNETPTSDIIKDSDMVRNARSWIERGKMDLCPTGVGGTYFVRDETNTAVAVFKPSDEEPGACNDPKRIVESPILPPGGGAKREVAAYVLGHALAKVPETCLLEAVVTDKQGCSVNKCGSVQKFVDNSGDATCFGSSSFCIDDVHNIGILDIRLLNKDRNGENILVQNVADTLHLVPIDHAYILPNTSDDIWFEWMTWRQAKQAFSQEALRYIASIDIEDDTKILRSLDIEEDSINLMRLSTILLQTGAQSGLSLYDIASMVCCRKPGERSDFECIVEMAKEMSEEKIKVVVLELVSSKITKK